MDICSFKASETLLGIETANMAYGVKYAIGSFKASETLLGIETGLCLNGVGRGTLASKPLKPF